VLEDISCELDATAELGRVSVPLKWRMLLGLPIINIVSGVVVVGLASPDHSGLDQLGLGVLVTLAVAFTLSLELSILLLRSILGPLWDLRQGTRRVAEGDLTVRVPVLGTDETGALAGSFNQMVSGLAEREALREAFGAYVDPNLAERVLAEGTVLEGEEIDVTVLFVDIRGFTTFAEAAGPQEVVERLNEFFELIVPVLVRHGGHASKFFGDGLLGVFGAPDRLADHADRAVAAALAIARAVSARYGDDLRIGVGVNSGPVVAGTIGGGGRVEFTVIGDAVNTAARVERLTRQTDDDVLVTEATRALLRADHGEFLPRGEVELRGRSEPVLVHAPRAAAVRRQPAPLRAVEL
jgi:class 3 adenylate cyclase